MASKNEKQSDKKSEKKPEKKPGQQPQTAKKPEKKPEKKAEKKADAAVAEVEAPKPKAVAEPRPPVDPRLKVLKKFHGKFLPKGPLRERLKQIMDRWNSGEDHGGVTHDELKTLLDDWRKTKLKRAKVLS